MTPFLFLEIWGLGGVFSSISAMRKIYSDLTKKDRDRKNRSLQTEFGKQVLGGI